MITSRTKHAIILAAGFGSRLQAAEGHKLLAVVGGRTMLDHHMQNFARIGVTHLTVVTGFRHEALEAAVEAASAAQDNFTILTAYNSDFERSNGLSVLAGVEAARQHMPDALPFWLTMGDHLFEPKLFDQISTQPDFDEAIHGALYIDRKLDTIFDVPDATKLRFGEDQSLDAIGKEIGEFNAVDVGLFWGREGFIESLQSALQSRDDCSTSDAVTTLERGGHFAFPDVGEALWQDVDTPEARAHAETLLSKFQVPLT